MKFLSEVIREKHPAEYRIAKKLYEADVEKMHKDGYTGDFGSGLDFAIDTYHFMCWAKYFPHLPYKSDKCRCALASPCACAWVR